MSVHCPTSSDYLRRTSNVVQPSSNYTCIYWQKSNAISANPNYQVGFLSIDDPATYNYFAGFFINNPTTKLEIGNGSSFPDITTTVPTVGTYYPIAYTRSGNVHSLYVAGVLIGTTTLNISAGIFGFQYLGNDTSSDGNIDFYNFREWNIALSLAQINVEINSPSAVVHSSGLVTFTPLTSDLLDISGNSNNWTAIGSPTFVANPTFPSNLTSATAVTIASLPYSVTQNVNPTTTYAFSVWYKYVAVANNILGFLGLGDLSVYEPTTWIFSPDAITSYLNINNQNAPIQVPVILGNTYYFEIIPNSGSPNPASLTVSLENAPASGISIGSLLINDDTGGFPAAIISGIDGSVINFINPFVAGERADIFNNGISIFEDGTNSNTALYNTSLVRTGTVAFNSASAIRINKTSQLAYLGNAGGGATHATVVTCTSAGVLGGTTFDLGSAGLVAVCTSPDDKTLYFGRGTSSAVHRWDLVNNVALTDLVATIASTALADLLGLDDGSILVLYFPLTAAYVKQYDSSGSLIRTFTLPVNISTSPKLAYAVDHPNSFWAWTHNSNGTSTFTNFKVSDGSTLNTLTTPEFEDGQSQVTPVSLTPARFGISQSCPFIVLLNSGSTIVVGKASNPLASGVTFTINGPSGSFPIVTDTSGQVISVTPGTYSITEVSNTGYQPSYFVSNDPVLNRNTAIVVGSGALVDVVILNTLSQKYGGLYTLVPGKQQDTLRNQDGSTVLKIINWFYELFTDRDK